MNQTQINLAILEARLAMRTEEWIANQISDEEFYKRLHNILTLSKNKEALKILRLDKVFNEDGIAFPVIGRGHNFDLGMLE